MNQSTKALLTVIITVVSMITVFIYAVNQKEPKANALKVQYDNTKMITRYPNAYGYAEGDSVFIPVQDYSNHNTIVKAVVVNTIILDDEPIDDELSEQEVAQLIK